MAYTTFTPKAANTVQAQTIAAITHNKMVPSYLLADGTYLAVEQCTKASAAVVPVVGDYVVCAPGKRPIIWTAAQFLANYS